MKKKRKPNKPRRQTNWEQNWQAIKTVIASNMVSEQEQDIHTRVVLPAYAALENLAKGLLDVHGLITLSEVNATTFCLAAKMHEQGTDAVKQAMKVHEPTTLTAANALEGIGNRYAENGKFGATGDELGALRKSIVALDELLLMAPKGIALRALIQAQKMVDESLLTMSKTLEEQT